MINLLNLFFPQVCEACSNYLTDNERVICTVCRHDMPLTNFHIKQNDGVKKVLYGRVKLVNATALFYFSKGGIVQKLMHNLKYRGHEHIGEVLGQWLGEELKDTGDYSQVDSVIPVPLHRKKLRSRGYNQVDKFAIAIARALNTNFDSSLLKKQFATKTQVFKSRFGRYDDSKAQFVITDKTKYRDKHILLVDDLITTGATIERCAEVLNEIQGLKISLATMAIAE